MTQPKINVVLVAVGVLVVTLGWRARSSGQQPEANAVRAMADPNKFEFEVVQSFDAKYDGDTPGHVGKSGGLANRRPQVALGDAVYRGQQKVGVTTSLGWSRSYGSLEVEFDPVADVRICVGDVVWLALDGKAP